MIDPTNDLPPTADIGRFTVRIIRPGGLLYLGTDRSFTRIPRTCEADHTIFEIYDTRYMHTPLGQFVTAYGAATLAEGKPGGRLAMHGGIEAWTLTIEETAALRQLALAAAEADKQRGGNTAG